MFKDHYKILEVNFTSSEEEIKKSYRRLSLKYHPDRNLGNKNYEEKFKEISESYSILSNKKKREDYDYEYNKYYNSSQKFTSQHQDTSQKYQQQSSKNSDPEESLTPTTIFNLIKRLESNVRITGKERLLQENVYRRLVDLLSDEIIDFLLSWGDVKTNELIISETLKILNYLIYPYVEKICIKLSKLSGGNNDTIQTIYKFSKLKRRNNILKTYVYPGLKILIPLSLFLWFIFSNSSSSSSPPSFSSNSNNDRLNKTNTPQTGNLYENNNSSDSLSKRESDSLNTLKKYSGWDKKNYRTGVSPGCFNYTPKYDEDVNNELLIQNTTDRDVVVKLMERRTNRCIRYVYIREGDEFSITNIPLNEYYTKIGYGKDWRQKIVDGRCSGKFIFYHTYKNSSKENEFYNFTKKYVGERTEGDFVYKRYSYNSLSLKLYVERTKYINDMDYISEDDFNDDN